MRLRSPRRLERCQCSCRQGVCKYAKRGSRLSADRPAKLPAFSRLVVYREGFLRGSPAGGPSSPVADRYPQFGHDDYWFSLLYLTTGKRDRFTRGKPSDSQGVVGKVLLYFSISSCPTCISPVCFCRTISVPPGRHLPTLHQCTFWLDSPAWCESVNPGNRQHQHHLSATRAPESISFEEPIREVFYGSGNVHFRHGSMLPVDPE
jgi:hypothetical protein